VLEKGYLRSKELARTAGISTDALRHYERMKVLPASRRSAGNYRLYPPSAVGRLQRIRRALAMGFSLAELARVLKVRNGGGAPCREVKRLVEQNVAGPQEQIAELTALRDHLKTVLSDWEQRLVETPEGTPARLLEL